MVLFAAPAIPAIASTIGYYAGVSLALGIAYKGAQSAYQRFQSAKKESVPARDGELPIMRPGDADPRVDAIVAPIVYPEADAAAPDANDFLALAEPDAPSRPSVRIIPLEPLPLIEASVQKLTSAQKIAILAPKLFFSGLGWVLGLALAPFLGIFGPGVGDAVGTFIGCMVSLGIEYRILKKKNDPRVSGENLNHFIKLRAIQAAVLSIGTFAAGTAFGPISKFWGSTLHPNSIGGDLLTALFTGLETAGVFYFTQFVVRAPLPVIATLPSFDFKSEQIRLEDNMKGDAKLAIGIMAPAQTAFSFSGVNSCNTLGDPLVGGAAVMIGGVVGFCLKSIFEKIMEGINRRRDIAKVEEIMRSEEFAELLKEATANSYPIRHSA